MTTPDLLSSLDVLLDHLVIGSASQPDTARARQYRQFGFVRAASILRSEEDERERRRFDTRLRLALHLAPATAIAYQRSNPVPRWRLVRDHLVNRFGRDPVECEPLSREIALVLDNWERSRDDVTSHRAFLLRRDGPYCANCHVRFDTEPISLRRADPYKPYAESPDELLTIEVDHIEAVSALGTNAVANLQLLCRLCNRGKGDGLGIDTRQEAGNAGTHVHQIPITHRARMLYYVIERDGRRCASCDSTTSELTIRPLVPEGGFIRSNLQAVCVACI